MLSKGLSGCNAARDAVAAMNTATSEVTRMARRRTTGMVGWLSTHCHTPIAINASTQKKMFSVKLCEMEYTKSQRRPSSENREPTGMPKDHTSQEMGGSTRATAKPALMRRDRMVEPLFLIRFKIVEVEDVQLESLGNQSGGIYASALTVGKQTADEIGLTLL